jgi:hypothetical protein
MKRELKQKPSSDFKIEGISSRSSARFDYIVFPLDVRGLAKCLVNLGFHLLQPLPPEPPLGPLSMGLAASGPVARKDRHLVDVSTERQFIGVSGGDSLSNYEKLREILDNLVSEALVSQERIRFHELQARYKVLTRNASIAMRGSCKNATLLKLAAKSYGKDMSLFTARLIAADSKIDSPDYFEIYIEPSIARPESELGLSIVFRNRDAKEFQHFVDTCDERLEGLVKGLLAKQD